MKKILLLNVLCTMLFLQLNAQQNVGIGTTTPHAKAKLQIESTDQGVIIPKMTTATRLGMFPTADPTGAGMMVYDEDLKSFLLYDGTDWVSFTSGLIDSDRDTRIHVDETGVDDDSIRFYVQGVERMRFDGQTLHLDPPGFGNTFIGLSSGINNAPHPNDNNVAGKENTGVGTSALENNGIGWYNTALGSRAMKNNVNGIHNTAVGLGALSANINGGYNAAFGNGSLFNNESGGGNLAVGNGALFFNETGSSNTAIGPSTLYGNISGTNNTALGKNADVLSDGLTNATVIGYNAKVDCDNCLVLGATGADQVKVGIGTATPSASAILDLNSTDKGILIPRVADTLAINSPDTGLMIFDNSTNSFKFYSGTYWKEVGQDADWTTTGNNLTNINTGNVGIGTNAPSNKLTVDGNFLVNQNIKQFYVPTWTETNGTIINGVFDGMGDGPQVRLQGVAGAGFVDIGNDQFGNFIVETNGDHERLIIKQDGNVGIGTSNPLGRLSLATTNVSNVNLLFRSDDGNPSNTNWSVGRIQAGWEPGESAWNQGHMKFQNTSDEGAYYTSMILKGGNVGIGTDSPQAKLDVNGEIQISNANIPMGFTTEVGGNSPILNMDVNFRQSNKNTTYRGAAFRIDSRDNNPLFQWLKRAADGGNDDIVMNLTEAGNLNVDGTATASAFVGDGSGLTNINVNDSDANPLNELNTSVDLNGSILEIVDAGGTKSVDLSGLSQAETDPQVGSNSTNWIPKWNGSALVKSSSLYESGSNVMVGTTSNPESHKFVVRHGTYGLKIQTNMSTTSYWEFLQENLPNNGNLTLFNSSSAFEKGHFNYLTGAYSSVSDRRLKENIEPLAVVLPKLLQLDAKSYSFKADEKEKRYLGFIAQEVETLFPEIVTPPSEVESRGSLYTMDYSGFGIIAIKAIQEQQVIIEAQQETIEKQQAEIDFIKAALKKAGISLE